ncbi:uncharacterized protein RJT20DRAFT_65593 [Scheffersomyces xylosifermentans]|uniref:uncharacterized protein n=1 Tax=Scheffersomyces xylosifermentans TaxID=1304137 RepID=UPI00315D4B97
MATTKQASPRAPSSVGISNERIINIPKGQEVFVRRASDKDLSRVAWLTNLYFKNSHLSKLHAVIKNIDSSFYLKDLNSTFGTILNDSLIVSNTFLKLSSGDTIGFIISKPSATIKAVLEKYKDKKDKQTIPLSEFASPNVALEFKIEISDNLIKFFPQKKAINKESNSVVEEAPFSSKNCTEEQEDKRTDDNVAEISIEDEDEDDDDDEDYEDDLYYTQCCPGSAGTVPCFVPNREKKDDIDDSFSKTQEIDLTIDSEDEEDGEALSQKLTKEKTSSILEDINASSGLQEEDQGDGRKSVEKETQEFEKLLNISKKRARAIWNNIKASEDDEIADEEDNLILEKLTRSKAIAILNKVTSSAEDDNENDHQGLVEDDEDNEDISEEDDDEYYRFESCSDCTTRRQRKLPYEHEHAYLIREDDDEDEDNEEDDDNDDSNLFTVDNSSEVYLSDEEHNVIVEEVGSDEDDEEVDEEDEKGINSDFSDSHFHYTDDSDLASDVATAAAVIRQHDLNEDYSDVEVALFTHLDSGSDSSSGSSSESTSASEDSLHWSSSSEEEDIVIPNDVEEKEVNNASPGSSKDRFHSCTGCVPPSLRKELPLGDLTQSRKRSISDLYDNEPLEDTPVEETPVKKQKSESTLKKYAKEAGKAFIYVLATVTALGIYGSTIAPPE